MIYISGPITGRSEEEYQRAFGTACEAIRKTGHTPISPARISDWGLPWAAFMRIAIDVLTCGEISAICMLPGWRSSRGAVIEWHIARAQDIPVLYADPADRRQRPPDAMGDDRGSGSADDWYRREFIERYDDGKKND